MKFNPLAFTGLQSTSSTAAVESIINNISVSNWASVTAGTFAGYDICYSPDLDLHIAGGQGTSIWTSLDGIVWEEQADVLTTGPIHSICWSSTLGMFVLVGSSSIYTSEDGITFTLRNNIVGDTYWLKVIWASGLNLLVAVGGDGGAGTYETIMTSTDGINWTNRTTVGNKPYFLCDLAYRESDNLLIAVTDAIVDDTAVLTSTDGITWSLIEITGTPNPGWYSIAYNDNLNMFLVASYNPGIEQIITSTNGTNWTQRTGADFPNGVNRSFYSPTYKKFILIDLQQGYCLWVSDDGINWENKYYLSGRYPNFLHDNGSYLLGADAGGGNMSHSLLR